MNVPVYFNIINGELGVFYTPGSITMVSSTGTFDGRIQEDMVCKINLNDFANLRLTSELGKIFPNVILPSFNIGKLQEVWKFVGYYKKIDNKITKNNLMLEVVTIEEFEAEFQKTTISQKIKAFKSLGIEIPDDIVRIIEEQVIPQEYTKVL
tara:strand:- start:182 stop:637 length:456 start_codon:yes stop_codon:yes gene_type:complete